MHGLGANSAWWESLGIFFLNNNISSYAIDLRGSNSFKDFENRAQALTGIIKKENDGKKIFALGESMGALIILSAALKDKALFDGMVCISPAFKSKAPLKMIDYLKIFFPIFYNPQSRYKLPLTADMCTRDRAFLKIIESDYDRDVLSTSKILFDVFIAQVLMRISRMDPGTPVLFLLAGDDKLVDGSVSKKVFNKLKSKDKTIIEYPGMYHSLSIELGKEKVFQDILKWAGGKI
ncbi:MAG: hypothetical protein A3I73_06180 [Omnitrophica bacterium RIFCSPLOWO2_02_FULL_45_16]|nr:MAG: hypothetical protein A3G36_03320 [Omnitrophica bacterium RIFCSPLOWO2_12_FULL_45_13]OGX01260.1 MAG: hypothetical protein A3I73_06180 [Omnitrophica bacterium RIFCSPLOWO2_02_FULL_45_16]